MVAGRELNSGTARPRLGGGLLNRNIQESSSSLYFRVLPDGAKTSAQLTWWVKKKRVDILPFKDDNSINT